MAGDQSTSLVSHGGRHNQNAQEQLAMTRRGRARLAPGVTWAKSNPAVGWRLPNPTPPEGTGVVFMFDHVNYKYALPNAH